VEKILIWNQVFQWQTSISQSQTRASHETKNHSSVDLLSWGGDWWGSGGFAAGGKAPVLGDFCNFSIKITYFNAYFCQNRYYTITHQLKAFKISLNLLNKIIEVQGLYCL